MDVAIPMFDNDNTTLRSVLMACVDMNTFSAVIGQTKIGETGYAMAIDQTGTIIAYPDETKLTERINYKTLAQADSSYQGIADCISNAIKGEKALRRLRLTAWINMSPMLLLRIRKDGAVLLSLPRRNTRTA